MPAVAVGECIYIMGGNSEKGKIGDIERFNTVTGEITLMKKKLLPRRYHTAEVYNGKIYIAGGYVDGVNDKSNSRLEIYDPAADSLSEGSPLPTPRYFASSVMADGKMYVFGGSRVSPRGRISRKLDIYDVKTDKWTEGAPMLKGRQTDVVEKDGLVYAVGGYDGKKAVKNFEVYDIKKDRWTRLDDLPFALSAHHCVISGDKIYSFGDYYELDRVWAYDFNSEQWDVIMSRGIHDVKLLKSGFKIYQYRTGPIYLASRHNAVVKVNETVYVMGGNNSTYGPCLDYIQSVTCESLLRAVRH
ncbi:MAG: kelch repeat-containing protein [Elusimicrobiota bacterium]|nr:kelch repeat-containing protein [Elusimicrobiota bacterium]